MDPATFFAGGSQASWLNQTSGGWQLPTVQTRFMTLASREGVTFLDERTHCQNEGAPALTLDAIEPSELSFFDPFVAQLNQRAPGIADRVDLCAALGGSFARRPSISPRGWRTR